MPTPKHIFGRPARPVRPIEEKVLARATIGSITVVALRWEKRDFEIEGMESSDSWFISYRVIDAAETHELIQFRSSHYIESQISGLRSISVKEQGDGVTAPKWHRSEHPWPAIEEEKARFVGQFYYETTVAYLYLISHEGRLSFVALDDDVSLQDIEDHYADEAKRG